MRIELHNIPIRDIVNGYEDKSEKGGDELGVVGYGGDLDIRPAYQREFVYKEEPRNAVIKTILNGFPLNVMYWVKKPDGKYEILDGQQRTISVCSYVENDFSIKHRGTNLKFKNLTLDEQDRIINYEFMVYICEGDDSEKIEWFKTINIAGMKLTDQEILNSNYTGKWLSDAKFKFSRRKCPALVYKDYMKGSPIRQDYLATVLYWISEGNTNEYMSDHQDHNDANALWEYFETVMKWVQDVFPKYRGEMKGLPWGIWYNEYKDEIFDVDILEKRITELEVLPAVVVSGIYPYLLSGEKDDKFLNTRSFDKKVKKKVYDDQGGECNLCHEPFSLKEMHADHIVPWSQGGKTDISNCQVLCRTCNLTKSDK